MNKPGGLIYKKILTLFILLCTPILATQDMQIGEVQLKPGFSYQSRQEGEVNLTMRARRAEQEPLLVFRGSFQSSENREISILEMKDNQPSLLKVHYIQLQKVEREKKPGIESESHSEEHGVTEGKTYMVRLQQGKPAFTYEKGGLPSAKELARLKEDFNEYNAESFLYSGMKDMNLKPGTKLPLLSAYFNKKLKLAKDGNVSETIVTYKGTRKDRERELIVIGVNFRLTFKENKNFKILCDAKGELLIDAGTSLFERMTIKGPVRLELKNPQALAPGSELSARGEINFTYGNLYNTDGPLAPTQDVKFD